jgi:hypothetical protein
VARLSSFSVKIFFHLPALACLFSCLIQLCWAVPVRGADRVHLDWAARYNGPANGDDVPVATVKYDPDGGQQWAARFDEPPGSSNGAEAMTVDPQGNVYVTGFTITENQYDITTVKYNAQGAKQWAATYDGPDHLDDTPAAIAVDGQGNVYVTGGSARADGCDYLTIKYDPEGQELWAARDHGQDNGWDRAFDLGLDIRGNVYVTGLSWRGPGDEDYDMATVKYSPEGEPLWAARYPTYVDQFIWGPVYLAVGGPGVVYVTGIVPGGGGWVGLDIATIKYREGEIGAAMDLLLLN